MSNRLVIAHRIIAVVFAISTAACGMARCPELNAVKEQWPWELVGLSSVGSSEPRLPSIVEIASEHDIHASMDGVCRWETLEKRLRITELPRIRQLFETAATDVASSSAALTCKEEDELFHIVARDEIQGDAAYFVFRFCHRPDGVESGSLGLSLSGNRSSYDAHATAALMRNWLGPKPR